eukprot:TRINITY_DN13985_c1_g1_i1.p1 TRINITY_DN13985_c1_g1~~TRINITY_DN13985_c1_g1_i1.p1  ORF type:complete len:486 (+),score=80.81 TRINITY_DN13985_c1_g1_i1:123-1460(+)
MNSLLCKSGAINACGISPVHGLFGCCGEEGLLECFDMRVNEAVGCMDAGVAISGMEGDELTQIRFDDGGYQVAIGTRGGRVGLFDLRSERPLLVKDHNNDCSIVDIKFHVGVEGTGDYDRKILSSDTQGIKIWSASNGKPHASIVCEHPEINDVCVWPQSGLIFAGCEDPRIHAYFLPSLGPAPKWCSYLEGLTEELEERPNTDIYENYRFVTRMQLEAVKLEHLIGTDKLRAYMHGYFIDHRLYERAKKLADPLAFEEQQQKIIAQKLEEERKSRISALPARKKVKVNVKEAARLAAIEDRLQNKDQSQSEGVSKKRKSKTRDDEAEAAVLHDSRFAALFEDEEYAIDERSDYYRQLHPNAPQVSERTEEAQIDFMDQFKEMEEEDVYDAEEQDDDNVDGGDGVRMEREQRENGVAQNSKSEFGAKEMKFRLSGGRGRRKHRGK